MKFNRQLLIRALQNGEPLSRVANRAVGTTTILALRALADAIDSCGEWVPLFPDGPDTVHVKQAFLRLCQHYATTLDLVGFEFDARYYHLGQYRPAVRCTFAEKV